MNYNADDRVHHFRVLIYIFRLCCLPGQKPSSSSNRFLQKPPTKPKMSILLSRSSFIRRPACRSSPLVHTRDGQAKGSSASSCGAAVSSFFIFYLRPHASLRVACGAIWAPCFFYFGASRVLGGTLIFSLRESACRARFRSGRGAVSLRFGVVVTLQAAV